MKRARLFTVVVLALALLGAACGDDDDGDTQAGGGGGDRQERPTITVGSADFTESVILGEIYGGALEAADFRVQRKLRLGAREIYAPALERGEIDLVPEYAATLLEYLNEAKGEATPDPDATTAKLNEYLKPKRITALTPSKAIDTNAFAVSKETAQQYNLTKLSDLAPVAGQLTLGGPPECPQRPFCAQGLETKYGIRFQNFRALELGPVLNQALENGDVDVALVLSTDGVARSKFTILEDDKQLQNADNVLPVVRDEVLTAEVREVLDEVSAALTTEDLAELNRRADEDKEDPEDLADEWLKDNELA